MTSEQAILDFSRRLLRFDAGAEKILPAAEEFPDIPMVQLCAAALHLYGQTDEDNRQAGIFLDRAEACGAETAAPEYLRALRCWHGLRYDEAAGILEDFTKENPRELLAAKFCEFVYYIMGQQFCGLRFFRHMAHLESANADDPDFLSMWSFAHELCGDFDGASEIAGRSLAIEARNPWAEHTLSHVLIRRGDIVEGERRLRKFLPQAATCSRPMHSHTAWHLALFGLERLDYADALDIFRGHIWGFAPDMVGEQIDAIALLWRMEMGGAEVFSEWNKIADHVEHHGGECFMPFLSAHHTYALARAGRVPALERLERTIAARNEPLWREVGVPVVRAAKAFGLENWNEAAALLDPIMPRITSVGGSDAQDDLFRQMYFVALARSGRKAEARAYWDRFSAGKKPTALDEHFQSLI